MKTRESENQIGFIYVMRSGCMIKVGYSADPRRRLGDFALANPMLELWAVFPGTHRLETAIHGLCREFRLEGQREWFNLRKNANARVFANVLLHSAWISGLTHSRDVYLADPLVREALSHQFSALNEFTGIGPHARPMQEFVA